MGICMSTTKVSGSNSQKDNNGATTTKNKTESTRPSNADHHQQQRTSVSHRPSVSHSHRTRSQQMRNAQQHHQRQHSRMSSGAVPYGKRTDFGYAKDFDMNYSIGKLLGHGQFGYTFVATDKSNGDKVAVKRIEKTKEGDGDSSRLVARADNIAQFEKGKEPRGVRRVKMENIERWANFQKGNS